MGKHASPKGKHLPPKRRFLAKKVRNTEAGETEKDEVTLYFLSTPRSMDPEAKTPPSIAELVPEQAESELSSTETTHDTSNGAPSSPDDNTALSHAAEHSESADSEDY
ncbi:hypothetical protein MTO96_045551 [Rhipicephalus appendiculatus]